MSDKRFSINGRDFWTPRETMDYASLVSLADTIGTQTILVSYSRCEKNADGSQQPNRGLAPGEECPVLDGMRVSVMHTGNA